MAKKRYKTVVAVVLDDGKNIGAEQTFEADPDEVAHLVDGGAIKVAPGRPPKQDDDED